MVAILHPVGPGVQIPIDRAVVLIGRSPECDVVLDISSKISRLHCALVQVDADNYIRDLGSMNGVTVGGQRVEKDRKLTNGVEVMIGDVKFVFLENVAPAVRTARPVSAGRKSPVLIDDSVEVLDVEEVEVIEVVEDVELVEDGLDEVEVLDDDVEVIEDVDVIEDVQIIEDRPRHRRPPRLR